MIIIQMKKRKNVKRNQFNSKNILGVENEILEQYMHQKGTSELKQVLQFEKQEIKKTKRIKKKLEKNVLQFEKTKEEPLTKEVKKKLI